MKIILILSGLAALSALSPAQTPDRDAQLEKIQGQFSQQRQRVQMSAKASYADQLRALRDSLQKSGDAAGAEKVTAELQSVLKQLAGTLDFQPGSPPSKPASADGLDSVFSDENDVSDDETMKLSATLPRRPHVLRLRDADGFNPRQFNRNHWRKSGAQLSWTLKTLAPGAYRVRLIYTAGAGQSGGSGLLRLSGNTDGVQFQIAAGSGSWKDVLQKDIARVEIKELPLTLTIEAQSVTEGALTLFDLRAVWLVSDVPPKSPPGPPSAAEGKSDVPK